MNSHMTPFDFSASSKFAKLSFSSVYPLVYSIGEDSDYLWHLEEWMAVKISGVHSRKPWWEMLVESCKRTANVRVLWCFSSFPCSSGDKANVRFPQPPKQKHLLWEFESIPHISLDYHPRPPEAPKPLLHISFLCQSLSTLRSSWFVKNCLDHRVEPKQIGQGFLHSDKKKVWRESYFCLPVGEGVAHLCS